MEKSAKKWAFDSNELTTKEKGGRAESRYWEPRDLIVVLKIQSSLVSHKEDRVSLLPPSTLQSSLHCRTQPFLSCCPPPAWASPQSKIPAVVWLHLWWLLGSSVPDSVYANWVLTVSVRSLTARVNLCLYRLQSIFSSAFTWMVSVWNNLPSSSWEPYL